MAETADCAEPMIQFNGADGQHPAAAAPSPRPGRPPDVSTLTPGELERTRRDLAASLALTRPGSAARLPIHAHLTAIDAELARRGTPPPDPKPTDNPIRLDAHLADNPDHEPYDQP